jgi:hypothetical protein
MFIYLAVNYKIARLFLKRPMSCALIFPTLAPFFTYFESGNFSEEYAMAFMAVALFIFIDYFVNNKISNLRLLICGLCFGAVCLIRINMIAIWIVFCIAVFLYNLIKEHQFVWRYLLWFLLGTVLIVAPFIIWLWWNGALQDFWDCYIVFNMKYSSSDPTTIKGLRWSSFSNFFFCNMYLLAAGFVVYLIAKGKQRFFHVAYLICMILTVYLVGLAGTTYGHYGMVLLPLIIYPLARTIGNWCQNNEETICVCLLLGLMMLTYSPWQQAVSGIGTTITNPNEAVALTDGQGKILNIIEQETTEDDPILVIGNECWWYVLSNRTAASRYAYQYPIFTYDETMMEEFLQDIAENPPKVVVSGYFGDRCSEIEEIFANSDDYEYYGAGDEWMEVWIRK